MRINFYKNIKVMLLVLVATFLANATFAQALSGVKTIDPAGSGANNYLSFSSAIDSLNKYGVGTGGVTYNVAAGATFAETKALVLTATGTASKQIVFQKSGTGASPIINPVAGTIATGTSIGVTGDVGLKIVGSDYLTIDGISIVESPGASGNAKYEYGIALLKGGVADGNRFVTIKNCNVSLNRTTSYGIGITSLAKDASFTSTTITALGRNENIIIQNNTINNVYNGIYFVGVSTSEAHYDNDIKLNDNTFSSFTGGTIVAYGAYFDYIDSLVFSKNNIVLTSTITGHTGATNGVYINNGTNISYRIDSNNINLNCISSISGAITAINNYNAGGSGRDNKCYIRYNKIKIEQSPLAAASSTIYGIDNWGGGFDQDISNNILSGWVVGSSAYTHTGAIIGIYQRASTNTAGTRTTIQNNIIRDITRIIPALTGTAGGAFTGISATSTNATTNIKNNQVKNIVNPSSASTTIGINSSSAPITIKTIEGNVIDSLFTGGTTNQGLVQASGALVELRNNLIRGIASNRVNVTTGTISGLVITSGTTVNAYNNIITGLTIPLSTSGDAIRGIAVNGGTTVNLSFNTVYIAGTGASGFGTSALYLGATTTLNSKNNIFYNECTPAGTGIVSAVRRSATGLTNYGTSSNNNLYYAGTPGATKLIYWDGVTATTTGQDQTLAAFKVRLAGTDALSLTGTLSFVNTTTAPFDVHINTATATLVESAAQAVTGITTDFDGNTRNVNNPDIGADEGAFIAGADLQGPVINYTALNKTSYLTNRTLAVTINDLSGVNTTAGTKPRIYYRRYKLNTNTTDNTYNGNTNATAGWKYTETTSTSNPYSFTLDYALLNVTPVLGDTIQYFVVAQDLAGANNISSNSALYTTTPTSVALTAANFPVTGNINNYRFVPQMPAVITVGSGGTYPNLTAATTTTITGGAFEAINNAALTQDLTVQILSNLDETGVVGLQEAFEEGTGAGTFKIKIVPAAASEDSIKGSYSGGLIRINQADRVIIDGSYAGSGNYLIFNNKFATAAAAGIHVSDFGSTTNGSTNVVIKNCTFTGPLLPNTNSIAITGLSVGGSTVNSNGGNHHNMVIDSNIFKSLRYGMYIANNFGRVQENLKIRYNTVGSADASIRYCGIYLGGANKALVAYNKISNISSGVAYSGATGIYISGSTSQGFVTNSKFERNTISKLEGKVLYAGANAFYMYQYGGVGLNDTISNNFITDLRNTAGYATLTAYYSTYAIAVYYGSGLHIYNNSINLFGDYFNSSTATAGTYSAGFLSLYGEQINFKNNLIVNKLYPKNATAQPLSASVGAWFYSGASTTGTSAPYVASLDNNNYDVSGNPKGFVAGIGGLVYSDLVSWQIGTNKDKNSFSDVALFVDSLNLHINSGTTGTLLESHGQNIVGLNRDIDNDLRPGPVGSTKGGAKAYDIGADEFDGVYLADIFAPTVLTDSISPAVDACSQKSHTFYLKVIDMSGVDTAQMLYTVNGVLKTPFMMTKTDSIRYRGTIPAVGAGLQVKVYIYAKDSIGNKVTKLLSTYTDAKFNFTATTNADTVAVGSTIGLNAILPNTAVNMGGTAVISTTGYPSPYNTSWWGNKEQYLFTAAELTAKGFIAGKITELGLLVGSVTTTLPLTNFTISMGHTTNTALSTFITAGMTNVYMNPSYVVLPNQINTHTFQTPFIWDGVSNVVIETCFNNSAYNGSQSITFTTTTNVSCVYSYADAATVCSSPGTIYTSSNRPNFIISQPLQATYAWTSSANGGLQSTNILNPDAIPTGAPGVYSYILAATSNGCTWRDTVDVRVITAVTPTAGFRTDTIAGVAGAKPTTIKVLNSAANYPNTWNYTITPNTYIFVNNTNAKSKAPNLQFTRAGVYSIKQKVENAAGVDSLTRTNYITIALKYCDAAVSYTGYNYISSVGLTSMNVGSGLTALPSYNNFTDSSTILPASLIAGRSDTVKVKLAAGSYGWATSNATAAWIDYNRNGQFENSEKLGEIAISAAGVTGNLIFKVPYTAESGITRMRVRTDAYNTGGVKACGGSNYGEIEDYAVNIAPAPTMVLNNIKVEQDTIAVLPATTNAVVVRSKVIVTGYTNRLSLTSVTLSTGGTTSLSDITNVKVYYTANKDTFNTNTLFGSATPAASLTINGSALLEGDTNYLWVAYDVASAAVVGNALDASITSMIIGGSSSTPSISSPAGNKYILLQAVPTKVIAYEPFGAIPVYNSTKGNPILAAKITMTNGVISQMNELKFKLSSTTKYQNIDKLYLVYTKGDSTYRSSYKEQFGQVPGSTLGTLTFTDTINLVRGNNYFWLVADATGSASVGDTLDGSFLSAKLAGRAIDTSTVKTTTSLRKFAPFPISGCTSAATSTADEDIGYVQVGDFINQSAASLATNSNPGAVNLYSNFGSLQGLRMQVEVPIDYKVNVINFGGSLYTTTVNIFVDLNQNGTFDLPKERVAKKKLTNSSADRVAIGSIKLPIGTKGGNSVMRVVATETSNPSDTLPACATYTWGETEDYIVTVSPAPPGDYYAPIISNVTLTPDSSCIAVAHTIGATIKDTTGIDSVWINWTKDGIAQTSIVMTHVGDLYSGTIPAQGLSEIRFSLRAQDNSPRANENTTKSDVYRDEYLKAALNAGPDGYVAAGGSYKIDASVKREPIFGSAQYTTMVYGFYRYYGAMKYQEILTAAELQAKGLTAGVINTIAWNTTGTQSIDTMLDFTVSIGNTTQADLGASTGGSFITSGLTQVINPRKFVPVAGGYAKSAVPFDNNFVWDGVSNIVISWCWSNNDGGTASSSTNPYVYYTTGNPSNIARYYYLDNVSSSTACGWSTEGYSTTARTDIMLKQSLPYTYNWTQSTNGGLSALNIPNPIATPTGGVGAYQYVVTVNDGTCTANDTVMVNVLPVPTVDLGAASGLICGTTPRVLDAGNPDAASYAWYVNNALDANTSRTMLASTAGVYKVVVRDRAGQTATDSISFAVGAAFTYNIGADTLGLCLGGTRTLDPGTYPSYLWSTGATTRTLAVSTTGIYSLTVSNAGGCIATDTFTVVSVAPTTVNLGANQAICTSAPLTLDAGNAGATYLWSTGATTRTIQAKFAGNYSVTVNTVTGCTLYDTIAITNLPAPAVSIGPDFQLCPGSTSVLDAGNAGNTFLWSTGATTQTVTISSAGTYYVTVTGSNGCSTNDTIVVTPKTAPVVSLGADQNICTSDTVTLDAGNAGATYLWSTGATTQTIRVSLANTYSVAVTNVGGCTTNDAVVITNKAVPVSSFTTQVVDTTKGQQVKFTAVAAAGTSYAWNFGDPTSASNTSSLSTPTHLFSAPGNYTVTLTVTNVATGCKSVTQTAVSVTGFANDFAKAFKLVAAPNPFAGNTKINYELPSNANVTLEVYDMIGRKVSTIANAAYQESGVHTYDFSAGDNQNASGVYMVRLIVDGQVAILRVIDIANR